MHYIFSTSSIKFNFILKPEVFLLNCSIIHYMTNKATPPSQTRHMHTRTPYPCHKIQNFGWTPFLSSQWFYCFVEWLLYSQSIFFPQLPNKNNTSPYLTLFAKCLVVVERRFSKNYCRQFITWLQWTHALTPGSVVKMFANLVEAHWLFTGGTKFVVLYLVCLHHLQKSFFYRCFTPNLVKIILVVSE